MKNRREVLIFSTLLGLSGQGLAQSTVASDSFPNRSVRIILPYPPGTLVDAICRFIGQRLGDKWGQTVVIDNKPGANGSIGTAEAAKSAPNGYTMVLGIHSTMTVNPHVYKKLAYDPLKDFVAVESLTAGAYVIVTHPSLPVDSFQGLINLAKSKPGAIDYATYGAASGSHLTGEMLNQYADIKIMPVHYKASPINDLVGGNILLSFEPPNLALPFINSGKIKALAVTTLKRLPALPNVPTVSEIYPKFESSPWFGFFAPTGTPKNIIDKISKDVSAIVRSEEMNKFQYSLGATPLLLGPEGLDKLMRQDYEIAKKQVQALNIVLD